MTKLVISVLATGSILFAGIIVRELAPWTAEKSSLPLPTGTATKEGRTPRLLQAENDAASLNEILARPLFTISRRPAARNAKAAVAPLKGRLAGIVVGPEEREALFVEMGKTTPSPLHEGEEIEGWRIEKIELERVTLRAGTVLETVEPAEDKKRATGQFVPERTTPRASSPAATNPTGATGKPTKGR